VTVASGVCAVSNDWFTFTTTDRSLRQLWEANLLTDRFYSDTSDPWWWNDEFSARKRVPGRRLQILVKAVPGSFDNNWLRAVRLLGVAEFVPGIGDVVEMMLERFSQGIRTYTDCNVRCFESLPSGCHVLATGDVTRGTFAVGRDWDQSSSLRLGLASARIFPES
jgi:hypothetical protein